MWSVGCRPEGVGFTVEAKVFGSDFWLRVQYIYIYIYISFSANVGTSCQCTVEAEVLGSDQVERILTTLELRPPFEGFTVYALRFMVQGIGFKGQGSGFRVQGSGFRV